MIKREELEIIAEQIGSFLKSLQKTQKMIFDEDFVPYNANHENILAVYSSITKGIYPSDWRFKIGKDFYGSCGKNAVPYLMADNEKYLFYSVKNQLNSSFIKKEIKRACGKYDLYIIQFDVAGFELKHLYLNLYLNNILERVNYEK